MDKMFELFEKRLPILEAIVNKIPPWVNNITPNTLFVCVQHLLYTTVNLINSLIEMGAIPSNIHILGKIYSSSTAVTDKLINYGCHCYPNSEPTKLGFFAESFSHDICNMWQKVRLELQKKRQIKYIIVLDDGGKCIIGIPNNLIQKYKIIGIEQTSSGINNLRLHPPKIPVINVAHSAVKQFIESPMIAEVMVQKLEKFLPIKVSKSLTCAVIGLGVIGVAVSRKLLSLNHNVIAWDKNPKRNSQFNQDNLKNNLEQIINSSEYIFGCSGYDITAMLNIANINSNKYFISCSSEDKEFRSLLKNLEQNYTYYNHFGLIDCKLENKVTINVLNKGYPINFDNQGQSVAPKDIQLTRGLLLGAVLQSFFILDSSAKHHNQQMLNPYIQKFVFDKWKVYGSTELFSNETLGRFENLLWITENSHGTYYENKLITHIFK